MSNQELQKQQEILNNLSEEERKVVEQILQEYSKTGNSDTLDELQYEDYEEIPVDIETFLDDNNYLGYAWHDAEGKSKLYPFWREQLKKIFPNNFDTSVNNFIASGARGLGKTELSIAIALYMMYRVMCLKKPIEYFHLKPTEKICFAFMNIKLELAEEIGNSKLQNTVKMSPWFMKHGTITGKTKKVWNPPNYIQIIIGSQADDVIGLPIYFCLDGDTEIITTNGVEKIKDLEDKEIEVYTLSNNFEIEKSEKCTVKQTAESHIEYQIELEDETIIKCTSTHRFMLRDGTYKETRYLTEEDLFFNIDDHNNGIAIKSIKKVELEKAKKYYDVINANPYNNFLIKTKEKYICSHNCFCDEVSFQRNQNIDKQKEKAINMIDTAIGGMKTRFVYGGKARGMLALASSKRSEKSFLEEHIKKKLKSEKDNIFIVDEPVWKVKPKGTYSNETFKVALGNKFLVSQVIPEGANVDDYIAKGYKIIEPPIDFRPNFIDDIERALCDFAGISSTEISKYISGQAWNDIITTEYVNPFQKEIIEVGNAKDDLVQYYDFFDMSKVRKDLINKPLFVHLDMSVSGDMTGIGGVWINGKKPSETNDQSKDLFFTVAFAVSVKAPKGHQISFEKNRNFIRWLRKQGFNVRGVSTDSFQSYDTGQTLQTEGFDYKQISVDKVGTDHICIPYQYFKSAIYEKRLECFEDKTLTEEVIDLERNINSGKVDHPDGGRKDISDSITGCIYNASQHAEEFAYDYGETTESLIQANMATVDMQDKEQIKVAFAEELKQIHQEYRQAQEEMRKTQENNTNNTNKENTNGPKEITQDATQPIIVGDSMLIW